MREILDNLIASLYLHAARADVVEYRNWALSEIRSAIPFDAALWGKGSALTSRLHTVTQLDIDPGYVAALEKSARFNPMYEALVDQPGEPIDIRDLLPGDSFHKSKIYKRLFKKYGVEQILSTAHIDTRSGLSSLISLYRFDADQQFSTEERSLAKSLTYHMSKASTLAFFLHLSRLPVEERICGSAVVDRQGQFHEAEPVFLDLLDRHFETLTPGELPFKLPTNTSCGEVGEVAFEVTPLEDLYLVRLRERTVLDQLTKRERQVVQGVCSGMSHKEIGRELGLAPTTVSSHLYRAYEKLGVASRAALTRLVRSKKLLTMDLTELENDSSD